MMTARPVNHRRRRTLCRPEERSLISMIAISKPPITSVAVARTART